MKFISLLTVSAALTTVNSATTSTFNVTSYLSASWAIDLPPTAPPQSNITPFALALSTAQASIMSSQRAVAYSAAVSAVSHFGITGVDVDGDGDGATATASDSSGGAASSRTTATSTSSSLSEAIGTTTITVPAPDGSASAAGTASSTSTCRSAAAMVMSRRGRIPPLAEVEWWQFVTAVCVLLGGALAGVEMVM